ncbi:hypothetical protein CIB48_g7366 [Xylaria polymorpha]|nr:hypothetical protein CIB48_g7366 [Xylaria polymorpha]
MVIKARQEYLTHKRGAPVILCGQAEQISQGAIATLKAEYDSEVHCLHLRLRIDTDLFRRGLLSANAIQTPASLQGEQSPPSDSALGSKDYSKTLAAVILGGDYDDAGIDIIMKASEGTKPIL